MFTASGAVVNTARIANPFGLDSDPAVAVAPNGNVLVTFTHRNANDPQAIEYEVWGDRYSPAMTVLGSGPFLIDNNGTSNDYSAVIANADNSFQLVYSQTNGSYRGVSAKISSTGIVSGKQPFTSTFGSGDYDLATSADGITAIVGDRPSTLNGTREVILNLLQPGGAVGPDIILPFGGGAQGRPQVSWVNSYTIEVTSVAASGDSSGSAVLSARYLLVNTITSDGASDNMVGGGFIDLMTGNGGDDTLDGGVGPDTMRGGAGNDTYIVRDAGDVIDESTEGSDGYDTVNVYFNYTLPAGFEALVLLGGATNGVGNAAANALYGNGLDNVLDGAGGGDLMRGFGGNDSYFVDSSDDVVDETAGGSSGWDTVYSTLDYTLPTGVEALVLIGGTKADGVGNSAANLIIGNAKANILKGGGGNDTIKGLAGKDTIDGGGGKGDVADYSEKLKAVSVTLDGSHYASVKVGGKVEDKLKAVENLIGSVKGDKLGGDSKDNAIDGGFGKDTIKGGGGADWLNGNVGKDVLTGGEGRDKFVFSVALVPGNVDTVTDFKHDADFIVLEDYLVGPSIGTVLDRAEFYAKAGAKKAHDDSDRIIYNKTTGDLYFDADGKGGVAAVQFAKLSNHPSGVDFHDFLIV